MGQSHRNKHLLIHNQGRISTFESKIGASVIDPAGTRVETQEHRLKHKANWSLFIQELVQSHI